MNLTQTIDAARNVLRFRHMAIKTEQSCVGVELVSADLFDERVVDVVLPGDDGQRTWGVVRGWREGSGHGHGAHGVGGRNTVRGPS
jgi:hypothetical protein